MRWLALTIGLMGCVDVQRAEVVRGFDAAGPDARVDATPADQRPAQDVSVADAGGADAAPDLALDVGPDAELEGCRPGETVACGDVEGACEPGVQTCGVDGRFGACEGEVRPQPERCNALDDDCDGQVDELAGDPCVAQVGDGCDVPGVVVCVEGTAACEPIAAQPVEICDGVDQDCDGQVDEAVVCDLPGADETACRAGTCALVACAPGRYDFDEDGGNGCEVAFMPGRERELGRVQAGPRGVMGPGGLAWAFATEDHLVLRTPDGVRDVEAEDGCEGIAIAATDAIVVAACRAGRTCEVLRSDGGPRQRLACDGPPGLTGRAGEAGVLTVVGGRMRWTSAQPIGLPVARTPEDLTIQADVRPFGFVHAGERYAVAVVQAGNRQQAQVFRVQGELIEPTGRVERGPWRHVGYFAHPGAGLGVLALHRVGVAMHWIGPPARVFGAEQLGGFGTDFDDGVLSVPSALRVGDAGLWVLRRYAPGEATEFTVFAGDGRIGVLAVDEPALAGAEALQVLSTGPATAAALIRREGRGVIVDLEVR